MARIARTCRVVIAFGLAGVVCLLFNGCRGAKARCEPSIEFTRVPLAAEGNSAILDPIEGRVTGAEAGQRVVLFAHSGLWWVQPWSNRPFTDIQPDSRWVSSTHPGAAYAALLVDSRYRPPPTLNTLPEKGGPVLAVAKVAGGPAPVPSRTLRFSGYDWEIRQMANDPGGSRNYYDPSNAWTDKNGFLHLRISRRQDRWMSGEVKLSRSLGYGTYKFSVRDVSHLEPATVLDISTWDDVGPPRGMHIEVSRWGEPEDKNAQYVIHPYVVPANVVRFNTPPGSLTYSLRWEPGRATFKTLARSISTVASKAVAEHVFTSGVPSPGQEKMYINLYVFANKRHPLRHETEVVVEKFEFLP